MNLRDGLRKLLPHRLPGREELMSSRWLAPLAHRLASPQLWRLTRRSVPRGVALGLFAGFIVPFGQILLAALCALPMRANLSVAALVTFVTNPLTLPFWVLVAHRVGALALPHGTGIAAIQGQGMALSDMVLAAGETATGFAIIAVSSAAAGYALSALGWRLWVGRKRRNRLARRLAAPVPGAPV